MLIEVPVTPSIGYNETKVFALRRKCELIFAGDFPPNSMLDHSLTCRGIRVDYSYNANLSRD